MTGRTNASVCIQEQKKLFINNYTSPVDVHGETVSASGGTLEIPVGEFVNFLMPGNTQFKSETEEIDIPTRAGTVTMAGDPIMDVYFIMPNDNVVFG